MKYRCNICGKLFIDEESVIDHILMHDSVIDSIDTLLSKYYTTVKEGELTYYKCEICGKQFIIYSSLRLHLAKHEEIQELISNKIREYYGVVR
jgi:DNA-directed RNA polymerase subunit RPC12/RpoP